MLLSVPCHPLVVLEGTTAGRALGLVGGTSTISVVTGRAAGTVTTGADGLTAVGRRLIGTAELLGKMSSYLGGSSVRMTISSSSDGRFFRYTLLQWL